MEVSADQRFAFSTISIKTPSAESGGTAARRNVSLAPRALV
jgi:hypothetical protein